ncbi:SSI family serine proteinase inhibitor [Actinomadura roseirufa]|uniref:SSI family serine proteinase inhibitor n=1 Tax=Actinomadura roseirufa TaxID=2094049 RepID=UPI0010411A27|nr:SSI family serine proteinase inhibitor [Actinomadura roseirufa]
MRTSPRAVALALATAAAASTAPTTAPPALAAAPTTTRAVAHTAPDGTTNGTAPAGRFGITRYDLREGSTLRWSLTCSPDGGTHPAPARACARLREINGDLDRLRHRSERCPRAFDPREVEIRGAWNGRDIVFKERYPNAACLEEATAPIVPSR